MPPTTKPKLLKRLLPLLIVLVIALTALSQYQNIYDIVRLRSYQPTASVVALADTTTMTTLGRRIFYVNHPQILDKQGFNQNCPANGGEQTIILGCYIPPQRGIYLYNVDEPQLKGVQEVTAAHEMLHGAYDRLGSKEKAEVDGWLQDYYATLKDDRLLKIFESYKKLEPNDLVNEMHAIFATEIAQLPPKLEQHYKKYFVNRQAVTNLAAQYQAAFTSRQNQIAAYDVELTTLKSQIEANQASLEARGNSLDAQRQQLNRTRDSADAATYNAQVTSFNSQVNQYNALAAQAKAQIVGYNDIVQKRNALAVETDNLSQELSSQPETQTAQ